MSRFCWCSTIHTLIKELQDEAIDPQSLLNVRGAPRKQELMVLMNNLEESLKELDEIVRKYQGLTRRERRIWNQLRLATEDLEANRSKLIFHVTAIHAFTSSLSRRNLVQIETALLELVSEVRQGRRVPSLASLHETNNDSVWRELENELAIDGISSTDITKHKAAIKIFIQGLLSETSADTTSLVEIASLMAFDQDGTDSESMDSESPSDDHYETADEEIPPKETGASSIPNPVLSDAPAYIDKDKFHEFNMYGLLMFITNITSMVDWSCAVLADDPELLQRLNRFPPTYKIEGHLQMLPRRLKAFLVRLKAKTEAATDSDRPDEMGGTRAVSGPLGFGKSLRRAPLRQPPSQVEVSHRFRNQSIFEPSFRWRSFEI